MESEISKRHEIEIVNSINTISDKIYQLYVKFVDNVPIEIFHSQYTDVNASLTTHFENITTGNFHDEKEAHIAMTLLVMKLLETAVNKSLANKDYVDAWTYISKAEFWSGCIFGLCNIIKDIDGSIRLNISESAKKGGNAKSQNQFGAIKQEVYRLFNERYPQLWHSRDSAAKTIYSNIRKNNPNLDILTAGQAVKTVSNWIKNIPNYSQHIKPKTKNNA